MTAIRQTGKGYGDRQRLADYRETFSTPAGKRVLHDFFARYWVFGSTMHAEPQVMAMREGERNVCLDILRYMEMKPADIADVRVTMAQQFGLEEVES